MEYLVIMKSIPILILHGWNLSASKFMPLQQEFRQRGYKVYCLDLPGFGLAGFPAKSLHLSDYVIVVKKFLAKNNIEKVIVIGHSFGGRIGIKLGVEKPAFIQALVLTGTPGINPVPRIKTIFFLLLSKIGKVILSFASQSFKDNAQKFIYRIARASDYCTTREEMRETFKNIIGKDLKPFLSRLNIPTLLLWGREDRIVPVKIAQKMNKLINNSKLVVIQDARHGLPWTHAKIFADEVENFIRL